MSIKRQNRRVEICLMVGTICMVLAGLWALLVIPKTALAKKPGSGGGDGKTQDIPVIVDVDDTSPGVSSDSYLGGSSQYIDKKKDHISAFVGRSAGQFKANTNTNNAEGGRTMMLDFSEVINPLDGESLPLNIYGIVAPITVAIVTARASVGEEFGYVDLRAMDIGEPQSLALRMRLTIADTQSPWDLNYGDVLWGGLSEGDDHWDENMAKTDYVIVERMNDIDGKKVWMIDTSEGTHAYLRRSEQWDPWIPVGIYAMPMSLTITEK